LCFFKYKIASKNIKFYWLTFYLAFGHSLFSFFLSLSLQLLFCLVTGMKKKTWANFHVHFFFSCIPLRHSFSANDTLIINSYRCQMLKDISQLFVICSVCLLSVWPGSQCQYCSTLNVWNWVLATASKTLCTMNLQACKNRKFIIWWICKSGTVLSERFYFLQICWLGLCTLSMITAVQSSC